MKWRTSLAGFLTAAIAFTPAATAFAESQAIGQDAPDRSYKRSGQYTLNEVRGLTKKHRVDLQNAFSFAQERQVLAEAPWDVHTVNPPTARVRSATELPATASPTPAEPVTTAKPLPFSSFQPASLAPEDVPLDKLLVSADFSWKSAILSALLMGAGAFGLIAARAFQSDLKKGLVMAASFVSIGAGIGWLVNRVRQNRADRVLDRVHDELPVSLTYRTSGGHAIDIYDANAAPSQRLSPDDLAYLNYYLGLFPAGHLSHIPKIVFAPFQGIEPQFDGEAADGKGILSASSGLYTGTVGHEVGHFVYFDLPSGPKKEFGDLNAQSKDASLDFVNGETFQRSVYNTGEAAYGSTNVREDFASIYGNWMDNSGYPQSEFSIFNEGIARAREGHSLLLQKTLLIASLFADSQNHTVSIFHQDSSYHVMRQDTPYVRTQDTLVINGTTFRVANGQITGLVNPGRADTPFSQPIPIPASVDKAFH